jgi:hypothetical protein
MEGLMHAVVRTYSGKGAKELLDVLEKNKGEDRKAHSRCKRLCELFASRTAGGGFSVSVFQDKAGTEESVRIARDWIAKNAGNTGASAPTVSEGAVILQVQ